MSEKAASIKISIKEGEFEITGSELFVTQQIENFRELMVLRISHLMNQRMKHM